MKLDYKNHFTTPSRLKRRLTHRWHIHGAVIASLCLVLVAFLTESRQSEASVHAKRDQGPILPKTSARDTTLQTFSLRLPKPAPSISSAALVDGVSLLNPVSEEPLEWQRVRVKPGYNLGIIAEQAGIGASEIYGLMQMPGTVQTLKTLYPGDEIRYKVSPQGKLLALEYDLHESKKLQVLRIDSDAASVPAFKVETIERPLEIRYAHASGIIQHSLFLAATRAGLSQKVTQELTEIFEWDIDYVQDVREGDRFTAIYQELYREGEKIGDGSIIAAEFINNGNIYRALRYQAPDGRIDYFNPEGDSLRKTFLRNPIEIARISSGFNLRRRHPILNKIRAHKGVDYAAASGTAIRATGDGKIVHRGRKGGYGNTIIIQHGQQYSTLYAHMSRFAGNTLVGRKVKQGQVIGYVGSTGLATGPHLHYEFRVNGVHRNPLTIQHPSVQPIATEYKNDFLEKTQPMLAQLDTLTRVNIALQQ